MIYEARAFGNDISHAKGGYLNRKYTRAHTFMQYAYKLKSTLVNQILTKNLFDTRAPRSTIHKYKYSNGEDETFCVDTVKKTGFLIK